MVRLVDQYGAELVLSLFAIVGDEGDSSSLSLTKISGANGDYFDDSGTVLNSKNLAIAGIVEAQSQVEADTKRKEIMAFLNKKGLLRLYVDDTQYYEVKKQTTAYRFEEDADRVIANMNVTFVVPDPFLKGALIECTWIVAPDDYPFAVNMRNPDPRANLRFGTYSSNTGVKMSDASVWTIDASGIYTSSPGHGFSFDCYGFCAINAYAGTTSRSFKVFIDGLFDAEPSYSSATPEFVVRYSKSFIDGKKHTVTVIYVSGAALYVNYVYLKASNHNTVELSECNVYPRLEMASVDTVVRFSPLGKVNGDVAHPVTIRWGTANTLAEVLTTSGTELSDIGYGYRNFLDGIAPSSMSTGIAGKYVYGIIEYNLTATGSGMPAWSVDDIKNSIKSFQYRIWACGSGDLNGALAWGADVYLQYAGWSYQLGNTKDYPALIEYTHTTNMVSRISSTGRISLVLIAKYPASALIPSTLCFDYCDLAVVFNRCDIGDDFLTNTSRNLIPPGEKWTLHANARLLGEYEMVLNATTTNEHTYTPFFAIKPNTDYFLSIEGNGIVHYQWQTTAGLVYSYAKKNIKVTSPANATMVRILFTNGAEMAGEYTFKRPVLTEASGIQPFAPQALYSLSLSEDQVITTGQYLTVDCEKGEAAKGSESITSLMSDDFDFEPLRLSGGVNHLQFNSRGGLLQAKVQYTPKWY